ncbi:MAG: uroporphyrinogen-III C-methyltransferase [Bosea sp. 32-68-6]|nr:MAG: uroporphyrinogen-III C-methyltransferase [Bosea sp. 32-68-6]
MGHGTRGDLAVHHRSTGAGHAGHHLIEDDPLLRAELFAALERIEAAPGRGRVSLVGAGPGDPELLTLKAIRALQSADIILYDDLVSPGVLELARREARRMMVGKTGYGPSVKQSDINALIVSLAGQGKHVVRLKGGDPGIFGRAGEEIEACQAAGLPVTIVPGISAAQGAAAALGVSLTHRDHARRLQFVTGHARSGELPEDLDWQAMADPRATTVIYMARATLAGFRDRAIAAGLDPATPAIAVQSATRPDEARVRATIATLPERLAELPKGGPVLVMLGRALGEALSEAAVSAERRRA